MSQRVSRPSEVARPVVYLTSDAAACGRQKERVLLPASAVGMIALAGGLALGLGGRKTAAQIVNTWYSRSQQAVRQLTQPAAQSQPQISGSDHARTPQTAKYSAGGTTS